MDIFWNYTIIYLTEVHVCKLCLCILSGRCIVIITVSFLFFCTIFVLFFPSLIMHAATKVKHSTFFYLLKLSFLTILSSFCLIKLIVFMPLFLFL